MQKNQRVISSNKVSGLLEGEVRERGGEMAFRKGKIRESEWGNGIRRGGNAL